MISLEIKNQRIAGLATERGRYDFDAVIVSTGGMSYPLTGSDGDGYKFARAAGHHVTDISPSLVPIICEGDLCASMQVWHENVALITGESATAPLPDFGDCLYALRYVGGDDLSAPAHTTSRREVRPQSTSTRA